MPTYKVTDPTTGKSVSLTGDSPPSESELEQIFSKLAPEPPKKDVPDNYWEDVRGNAKEEIVASAKSAPQTAKTVMALTNMASGGIPSMEDLATVKETIKSIPSTITGSLVDTANSVMHPINSFRERPISTSATIGSLLFPAAKGVMGMRSAAGEAIAPKTSPGIAKRVFAKGAKVAFGTPEEAVLARMENPNAVKTAFSHADLADQMSGSVKNLSETIKSLSDEASKTLSSSPYIEDGAIPKTKIAAAIKSARRDLGGVFSNDAQAASGALERVAGYYKKLKSTVSEAQVKDLIQQIDGDIDWKNVAANKTNKALAGVRTRLDAMLKSQNTNYKEAMVPVDESMRVMGKIQKTFGIENEPQRGFFPNDQAPNRLRTALKEDKLGTQRTLDRFQKLTGEDWATKIKNANAKEAFERAGKGMGSTRSNAGAAIGTSLGGMVAGWAGSGPGAAIGAVAGAVADVYGPKVAARLTDALANPAMARYVSVLENAAAKGAQNVAATHAVLMETDKKYAEAVAGGRTSGKVPGRSR